uniref:Uncharacterized protein n=1 Tax=Arundo donax TaxID=35708 RepID=A0A0A9BQB2_ARUDO
MDKKTKVIYHRRNIVLIDKKKPYTAC